jgi:hypothetical protein
MVTVVGPPLALPLIEAPTQADIDFWHGQYMEELKRVFERNKGKYAAESNNAGLVMLEKRSVPSGQLLLLQSVDWRPSQMFCFESLAVVLTEQLPTSIILLVD